MQLQNLHPSNRQNLLNISFLLYLSFFLYKSPTLPSKCISYFLLCLKVLRYKFLLTNPHSRLLLKLLAIYLPRWFICNFFVKLQCSFQNNQSDMANNWRCTELIGMKLYPNSISNSDLSLIVHVRCEIIITMIK